MTNHAADYRPWHQLTKEEQDEIRRDPEHRYEDYARHRWKRSMTGQGPTWDKWQDGLLP